MNIFAIHENPREAARQLCDAHIVKMPIEATQMLSLAMHEKGLWVDGMCKPVKTYMNHPCTKWVRASWANFTWLAAHAQEAFQEYTRRYLRTHETQTRLELILLVLQNEYVRLHGPLLHWKLHTPFVQTMEVELRHPDGVQAHRNLYITRKAAFARWRHSERPAWMDEAPVLAAPTVNSGNDPRRNRTAHPSDVRLPDEGGQGRRRRAGQRRGQDDGGSEPRAGKEAGGAGQGNHRRAVGRARQHKPGPQPA